MNLYKTHLRRITDMDMKMIEMIGNNKVIYEVIQSM